MIDSEARATVETLFARLDGADDSPTVNQVCDELRELIQANGAALALVSEKEADLHGIVDAAKLRVAAITAKLALLHMAIAVPDELTFARRSAGVPAPRGERLMAALVLLSQANQIVPFDENTVTLSLDPLRPPDFNDQATVWAGATELLRTAGYFVLDAQDAYEALLSDPPEQDTFPPLPFSRTWIEMRAPGEDRSWPYMRFVDPDEQRDSRWNQLDVLGVGIAEVDRGRLWDVYIAFEFVDHNEFFFIAERIGPGGVIGVADEAKDVAEAAFAAIRRLVVGGAHLITAKNVPHDEIVLPRHQRKRLRAEAPEWTPRLYYVNLASSGEQGEQEPGRSSREYHVRWLVRGHWRHLESARKLCTCCVPERSAMWIEPYIKGPVGAPWKGRAVHRQMIGRRSDGGNSQAA